MRTAVDVVAGASGHDLFRLHTGVGTAAEAATAVSYGLAGLRPGDVQGLHPLERGPAGDEKQAPGDIRLELNALADEHTALVLPGYYPPRSDGLPVIATADLAPSGLLSSDGPPNRAAAVGRIPAMVAGFLDAAGDDQERRSTVAARLRAVRLLVGGPDDWPRQRPLLLPLADAQGASLDADVADALARGAPPRAIHIFPEYRRRDARMLAGWAFSAAAAAADDDVGSVALPALGSSVDQLRQHVADLCRLVPGPGGGHVGYDPHVHIVRIQSLLPPPSRQAPCDARVESSTFFLGPSSTDDWFRVRAQIPTRRAIIRVLVPTPVLGWRAGVARSNIWGPRYGRAAASSLSTDLSAHSVAADIAALGGSAPKAASPSSAAAARSSVSPADGVAKCPFADCAFTYRCHADADDGLALAVHARERHVVRQCLWCDELMDQRWTDGRRDQHLRHHHRNQLMAALGVTRASVHYHDDGGGVIVASVPLAAVEPCSLAASVQAPARQPLDANADARGSAWTGTEGRRDEREDRHVALSEEETDREDRPGVASDDGDTDREDRDGLLADDGDADPARQLAGLGTLPQDSYAHRLRAIGQRYLARLPSVPDGPSPDTRATATTAVQRRQLSVNDSFIVYEDLDGDEGGGNDAGGRRAMSEPLGILGELPGTATEQPALESAQAGEQANEQSRKAIVGPRTTTEDDGAQKSKEPAEVDEADGHVEKGGGRGTKRRRPAADEQDAAGASAANKRKKTGKAAAATAKAKPGAEAEATKAAKAAAETARATKTATKVRAGSSRPTRARQGPKTTGAGDEPRAAPDGQEAQGVRARGAGRDGQEAQGARARARDDRRSGPAARPEARGGGGGGARAPEAVGVSRGQAHVALERGRGRGRAQRRPGLSLPRAKGGRRGKSAAGCWSRTWRIRMMAASHGPLGTGQASATVRRCRIFSSLWPGGPRAGGRGLSLGGTCG